MSLFNTLGTVPRYTSTPGLGHLLSILETVLRHQTLGVGRGGCPTCEDHLEVLSPSELTLHVKGMCPLVLSCRKHSVGLNYPDKRFWVGRSSSARAMGTSRAPGLWKVVGSSTKCFFFPLLAPFLWSSQRGLALIFCLTTHSHPDPPPWSTAPCWLWWELGV